MCFMKFRLYRDILYPCEIIGVNSASKGLTFDNCCFSEHPQKYCHDNIGCITQTVNKTLEYVSTPPPNKVTMDVMTLPSVGGNGNKHELKM